MSRRDPPPPQVTRSEIKAWFDATYTLKGLRYLRPPDAYAIFIHLLAPQAGQTLLDVACGPGHLLGQARDRGLRLFGVDLSTVAVDMARRAVPEAEIREADAAALPFPDDSFDYVTCIGSLERMIDLAPVLGEQLRVARPTARLCYMVRNSETWVWRLFMERLGMCNRRGHQGAARLEAWTDRFEGAGFRVDRVLPDQWPLMAKERILKRLGLATEFTHVRQGWLPLRRAGELIFLLSPRRAESP